MGDRTTLYIEALKTDRAAVAGLFGDPEEQHPSTSCPAVEFLVFGQVNYGGTDLLESLAKAGVPFSAYHEDGDEYYGMAFAACDGAFAATPSPRGSLMVCVNARTLEPCADALADLRHWRDTEGRVRARFAAAPPPPPSSSA
jgi:hypothetical protein